MDPKIMEIGGEIQKLLGECWRGLCITAGINAGFFSILSDTKPLTIEEIASKFEYDPDKVEKWCYFAEQNNLVKKQANGYLLDVKGIFFTQQTPIKDLLGFFVASDYFMRSVIVAKEAFKKNKSLNNLSEGKMSTDYQPKVSDNLSAVLVKFFKEAGIKENDTLLDFGCGHGSFLRNLSKIFTNVKFKGVDSNIFAIEMGKKENNQIGLNDRIDLVVGDITADMDNFEKNSSDWVTAINLLHYVQPSKRMIVVDNMLKIARKGIFMTEGIIETSVLTSTGDVLLTLLMNDYTGAFKKNEVEEFNKQIQKKYSAYSFKTEPIMQGTSLLVIMTKS